MGCKLRDNILQSLKIKTQVKDIKNPIKILKTQEKKIKMPLVVLKTYIKELKMHNQKVKTPYKIIKTPIKKVKTPIEVLKNRDCPKNYFIICISSFYFSFKYKKTLFFDTFISPTTWMR